MNSCTNDNPFTRFDDLVIAGGFSCRTEARQFIQHFRWFDRSDRACPKCGGWAGSWKRLGYKGTFGRGQNFNMATVYAWCEEHGESVYGLLKWLDAASAAVDECDERCEAAYWRDRLHDSAFDDGNV